MGKQFAFFALYDKLTKITGVIGEISLLKDDCLGGPTVNDWKDTEDLENLNGQLDVFTSAGLKKPDISILSDEFLGEVKSLPHPNVAVELLRKLLTSEIKTQSKKNVVQARSFADMLKRTVQAYQNRGLATFEVIEASSLARLPDQSTRFPQKASRKTTAQTARSTLQAVERGDRVLLVDSSDGGGNNRCR